MNLNELAARTALVLETNNLRGGADLQRVAVSLGRLFQHLKGQSLPLTRLAQVVVTHDGLPEAVCEELAQAAGLSLQFVPIDAQTGYYAAKNLGFAALQAERCDHVVFADADCIPAADWLEQLLLPLCAEQPPAVVAGRTSYSSSLTGTALTTIDFMYFPSPLAAGATRNFYANNVVFRREVFAEHAYQALDGVYRAHCQVLGLNLQAAGIALHYAAAAHTEHRLPDTRGEALKLRWMRGQDSVGLTPYLLRAYLPQRWQWLAHSGPLAPLSILLARLYFSQRALNHQGLPALHGLRGLGARGLILAFSLVDMAGALARGVGINTLGRTAADAQALSYHRA
ncbi:glycosyltransferase [Pseudomonas sp. L-22-4S-12]|uniref:glycosyltransferase n=1 Tax=Pseudomonas sp. L-22-4S-12 TaxID=2610893 RepID=UPI001323632E|nr:glycosyltransferase [Pseudomonas sp. L-22-4S-12]MWV15905.1 glycosyltransferase [Pseudomonas sp. L-22-4S-12]